MNFALRYPATLEVENGSAIVRLRDFPEALTEGLDKDQAVANAIDCLDAALHFRMKDGAAIPTPSPERSGDIGIVPTTETSMRVALYQAHRGSGLSLPEFAQRIGMDPARLHEILTTYRAFDLRKVGNALQRLGKPVVLSVDAA